MWVQYCNTRRRLFQPQIRTHLLCAGFLVIHFFEHSRTSLFGNVPHEERNEIAISIPLGISISDSFLILAPITRESRSERRLAHETCVPCPSLQVVGTWLCHVPRRLKCGSLRWNCDAVHLKGFSCRCAEVRRNKSRPSTARVAAGATKARSFT
jgi:hypothetical protein